MQKLIKWNWEKPEARLPSRLSKMATHDADGKEVGLFFLF